MTALFTRWLAMALVAVGLGVAGLQLSVCVAAERAAALSPASRPGVFADARGSAPLVEAEVAAGDTSASVRLTY